MTVTTTPKEIGYNQSRTSLLITNRSGVTVYFGYDASVSATEGISLSGTPILGNNGRMSRSREKGDDARLSIFLVVATGTATVNIHEDTA